MASACAGRRLAPAARAPPHAARRAPCRPGPRCRAVVDASPAATRSRSGAELVSRPRRLRSPARRRRHRRSRRASAASDPSGLAPNTSRVRGSKPFSTAFTGEGTASRSSRRVPARHRRVAFRRGGEHRDIHCRAGVDQRRVATDDVPADRPLDTARQLVQVVGPCRAARCVRARRRPRAATARRASRRAGPAALRDPCRWPLRCRRALRRRRSPADERAACPGRRR